MDPSTTLACKQVDEGGGDFNLKEWGVRARRISRESSRRFSASNLKSFREEARSFAVSSTASSPGYTVREEIDPTTYSFTTALKALQAKTWEFQSPDGLTLNSKWYEAEKYICNPLSGEVPLECLSAKTLRARSFRGITMSGPLIYPSQMQHLPPNPTIKEHEHEIISNDTKKKKKRGTTRDVGTQSTPIDLSSSSPSPAPTPSIEERSIKMASEAEGGDVESSLKSDDSEVEGKERRERNGGEREKLQMMGRCSGSSQGGCLSLRGLWMSTLKHRDKHKPRTNMLSTFLHHLNACSKQ